MCIYIYNIYVCIHIYAYMCVYIYIYMPLYMSDSVQIIVDRRPERRAVLRALCGTRWRLVRWKELMLQLLSSTCSRRVNKPKMKYNPLKPQESTWWR